MRNTQIIILSACILLQAQGNYVEIITPDRLSVELKKQEIALVTFYHSDKPYSDYCVQLIDQWIGEKPGERMKTRKYYALNCKEYANACDEYNIDKLPTIRLYDQQQSTTYVRTPFSQRGLSTAMGEAVPLSHSLLSPEVIYNIENEGYNTFNILITPEAPAMKFQNEFGMVPTTLIDFDLGDRELRKYWRKLLKVWGMDKERRYIINHNLKTNMQCRKEITSQMSTLKKDIKAMVNECLSGKEYRVSAIESPIWTFKSIQIKTMKKERNNTKYEL